MSWKGIAELLKSLRVGWEKSIQSVEAHMAANIFIDNGPVALWEGGKTSDGIHGSILIQPNVPIIPAIGQFN